MCVAAEFPPFGPVSRQTSLITTHIARADTGPRAPETSSLPQRQPLLDAESILPRQAAALAEEAQNTTHQSHLSESSTSSKRTILDTIAEASEAVLGLGTPQEHTVKGAGASVDIVVQAEVQQPEQQQQSSEAAGLNLQSMQHGHTSSDAPKPACTTEQPLDSSVQPSAGVHAVEEAELPSSMQQGADMERSGSRPVSADSREEPSSTSVEVSIMPD